jgi:hypothetical protein
MLVVFGLNKDIWNQLGTAERALYNWAAGLYLLSCLLSASAGIRFMHQLFDSYTIGILGGLMVGYIVSVVTRIALITMVSLPIHPATHSPQSAESADASLTQQSRIPDFSVIFRLLIIALMSLVVAMPVAAIIGYNQAEIISDNRREQVLGDFKANHPDMSIEQNRILNSNLQSDHFPIYVYRELAHQPIGLLSIFCIGTCFLVPFFMLWHLRTGSQFQYATMNRDMLVDNIDKDYRWMLECSRSIQQNKYGMTSCVMPNQAWLDPPFNTRSIEEQSKYTLETEAVFLERLKTL